MSTHDAGTAQMVLRIAGCISRHLDTDLNQSLVMNAAREIAGFVAPQPKEPVTAPSEADVLIAISHYGDTRILATCDKAAENDVREAWDELRTLLVEYGRPAQPLDPYDAHMANQASLIDMERLRRWLTAYGISTPESMEMFTATFGKQVNALTRQDPFPAKEPGAPVRDTLMTVLGILDDARESIGGGALAENAQYERSIVEPYLDGVADEVYALLPREQG